MNRKKDYKDLEKFKMCKRKQQERWRKRSGAFKYGRRKWTEEEDMLVLQQNKTDRELSKEIHRSIGSIYTRRSRLTALERAKVEPYERKE